MELGTLLAIFDPFSKQAGIIIVQKCFQEVA